MEEKNKAAQNDYILEFEHVTKVFPGVRALDDINFGIKKGTVHVIVGENGAGKSTLLKVINGLYKADEGRVLFEGKPLNTHGPADALKAGIKLQIAQHNQSKLEQKAASALMSSASVIPQDALGTEKPLAQKKPRKKMKLR